MCLQIFFLLVSNYTHMLPLGEDANTINMMTGKAFYSLSSSS